ncbi:tyrosine-type recombinase/integrase [Pontixanthobacter gangjinensis]|uniref:Tyrosine-type recombinase/integrase n=1 Tax=Pontixanthobacter gangjinensis TaxID=1028742 RepID=A0A6I4SS94_9SPHN|nr:site-specific integrase [Pontixanthobacter gangjinensis]MXO57856.1 tyrosine-type recombinase/integrase [Pontixanthobacter gangjinensis]
MPSTSSSMTDTVRTQNEKQKLSDQIARETQPPAAGNRIVYDSKLSGFGLRVTAKGVRSFVLNYRVKGRERRITIGQYPAWTVLAARKQAEQLRRSVDLGLDPLEERVAERSAPTVRDLFDRYAKEHLPTKAPRSAADDRSMWIKDILPALAAKKVSDLCPQDCDELHRTISLDRPTRANRVIEVLRKALNLAIRWGWIERNVASGARRNPELKRTRYLSRKEVAKLIEALESHQERTSADALLFMLLTGCRRSEALNARWDQFDLERRVWTKASSETKQRREHRVPYSETVAEILQRRRAETEGTYIYPGRLGAPLADVRRTWKSVCEVAGLDHVRIHDLRHTFASIAASSGQSLYIVGQLLGHSSPQTTKRYASLYDDTLRSAAEGVSAAIGFRER